MLIAKRIILAAALTMAVVPVGMAPAAFAAAPAAAAPVAAATPADATATDATATAATTETAAPASTIFAAEGYERRAPEPGIGQPVDGGMDFQPQVTANGEYALWLNNALLLPLMAAICLVVLGLMMWIAARFRAKANPTPSRTSHNTLLEVLWTGIPVLILAGIAVPSISLLARQYAPPPADAITIKVTGYQWYWGYAYPDHEVPEFVSNMLTREQALEMGEPFQLAVDNRLVVPVGETIKLIVTGSDVIHSFAVPSLWTKMDAVPGRLNEVTFRAEREGVYYGQCSELCGVNHAFMPIAVEVVSEEAFARYIAARGGRMPGAVAAEAPGAAPAGGATAAPAAAVPAAAAPAAPAPAAPAPAAPAAATPAPSR